MTHLLLQILDLLSCRLNLILMNLLHDEDLILHFLNLFSTLIEVFLHPGVFAYQIAFERLHLEGVTLGFEDGRLYLLVYFEVLLQLFHFILK